jgi:hypothetical protein
MQLIFYTEHLAKDFSTQNGSLFPEPPQRCPFKDCSLPIRPKKHGYYIRYYISRIFAGVIYIRRYICPVCGRTISMLPVFCLPKFQYSGLEIINMLQELYQGGVPLKVYIAGLKQYFSVIDRRHINYYRKRVKENRKFIQYGLNLISPGLANMGLIPEDQTWVREFLDVVNQIQPRIFLVDFYQKAGESFMDLQNMVA